MTLAELRARFRQRADDLQAPYLWSDPEVDAYANEAVNEAAERAYLLYDAITPEVTLIVGAPERGHYPVHGSILEIDRVVRPGTGHRLAPINVDDLDRRGDDWPEHTGNPLFYLIQGTQLILYPRPSSRMRIRLSVYRLPKSPMFAEHDSPEIEARHHERLVDWMLYRAYSKRDADAEDAQRADRHLATFAGNFGLREDADTQRKQAERRRPVAAFNRGWGAGPSHAGHRRQRFRRC